VVVKKAVPKRVVKATPPTAGKDDITKWQDEQPAVSVLREDPTDDDYFPGDSDNAEPVKAEIPPKIPSPLAVKAREMVSRARNTVKPTRKPKTPKPRVSVDNLIGMVWQGVAQITAPINLPVARVLDMQAPVAGMLLEDVVKDTVVDRMLQPLARMESGGETAFALMGPPILVGLLTSRPQLAPILLPMLRQALMSWIEIAGPKLEAVAKKEQKFQEQYGQRIDEMISYFISTSPGDMPPNATNNSHATAGAPAA
jgi:hypothetical protein